MCGPEGELEMSQQDDNEQEKPKTHETFSGNPKSQSAVSGGGEQDVEGSQITGNPGHAGAGGSGGQGGGSGGGGGQGNFKNDRP